MKKISMPLICIAFLSFFGTLALAEMPSGDQSVELPELRVATLDGPAFDLSEQRGKWVVINYWATWCSPCLKEMPDLRAFAEARNDVALIGLAYEDISAAEMRAFLADHPAGYPISIVDVFEPPASFPAPRGLPMTWLIDPQGRVAKQFLGPITGRDLTQVIEAQSTQ